MEEDKFFEALSNSVRRRIIELLYDRIELTYTELLNYLNLTTGVLNFHLHKLDGLVEKTDKGTYRLTAYGKKAYYIIKEFRRYAGSPPQDPLANYRLTGNIVVRRAIAFIIDVLLFLTATGIIFDPLLWSLLETMVFHATSIFRGHPWIFHLEHFKLFYETLYRAIAAYSHAFFAMFIFFTLLETYKGQTPGKHLTGLRVVKRNGRRLDLVEAAIRNAGKLFLLPVDLAIGVILYSRRGYLRYTDYYIDAIVERV